MAAHLAIIAAVSVGMVLYIRLVENLEPPMSGDRWYTRQFAYVGGPVSAPYCWRPLLPLLARYLGFELVSYSALLMTPIMIYGFAGGGWVGVACALAFIGNPHIFRFAVRNPEYDLGLVHLLLVTSMWAMAVGSPAAWVLLPLAATAREGAGLSLAAVALFVNPPLALASAAGLALAYFTRNENKENRHPLVETSIVATTRRWAKLKGHNFFSFAHVVQPLRGLPLSVPFVWGDLGHFARAGLIGFLATWASAIPASGQCRILAYSYAFFVPVVAAFGPEWAWVYAGLSWWWPIDYLLFDETGGGDKFSFLHGAQVQHVQPAHDAAQQAG